MRRTRSREKPRWYYEKWRSVRKIKISDMAIVFSFLTIAIWSVCVGRYLMGTTVIKIVGMALHWRLRSGRYSPLCNTHVQNKPKWFSTIIVKKNKWTLLAFLQIKDIHEEINATNRSQTGSLSLLGNISSDGANVIIQVI